MIQKKSALLHILIYIYRHTAKDTQYTYKNYLKLMSDSTF